MAKIDPLVSTERLATMLDEPHVRILDATYCPLDPWRNPRSEYMARHLPGTRFLDLATLVDRRSSLPSMLPTANAFRVRLSELGVEKDDHIVLYDDSPQITSARAWWVLREFGFTSVSLLDGGFARWISEERPLESGAASRAAGTLIPTRATGSVRTMDDVQEAARRGDCQIVDARSLARFAGIDKDPRPGVAAGHIPGSLNLPYGDMLMPDGRWKQGATLRRSFTDAHVDPFRPMITTCGSGITAAVIAFGAYLLGNGDAGLYDGSWSEWGASDIADIELGMPAV
jgi:thiosulfate/3-mercaptopyruvate sulfurtransferase